jgi:hypothetical protein
MVMGEIRTYRAIIHSHEWLLGQICMLSANEIENSHAYRKVIKNSYD